MLFVLFSKSPCRRAGGVIFLTLNGREGIRQIFLYYYYDSATPLGLDDIFASPTDEEMNDHFSDEIDFLQDLLSAATVVRPPRMNAALLNLTLLSICTALLLLPPVTLRSRMR